MQQATGGWTRKARLTWFLAGIGMIFFGPVAAQGDEGMWLFNNPPKKILKEKYDFEPDQAWFDHLQRASVRFNSGGSGSFVSSKCAC